MAATQAGLFRGVVDRRIRGWRSLQAKDFRPHVSRHSKRSAYCEARSVQKIAPGDFALHAQFTVPPCVAHQALLRRGKPPRTPRTRLAGAASLAHETQI